MHWNQFCIKKLSFPLPLVILLRINSIHKKWHNVKLRYKLHCFSFTFLIDILLTMIKCGAERDQMTFQHYIHVNFFGIGTQLLFKCALLGLEMDLSFPVGMKSFLRAVLIFQLALIGLLANIVSSHSQYSIYISVSL